MSQSEGEKDSFLSPLLCINDQLVDLECSNDISISDAVKSFEEEQIPVLCDSRLLLSLTERSSPIVRAFDDWLAHNEERVIQSAILAHQLISEAISLSDSQTAAFKVALTIPKVFLSLHHRTKEDISTSSDIVFIKITDSKRNYESTCSLSRFAEVISRIKSEQDYRIDKFFDSSLHQKNQVLLGIANISCECLAYDTPFVWDAPIVSQTGKTTGKLKLRLECVPSSEMSVGSNCSPGANVKSDKNDITAKFTIMEASGIPINYSHELSCLYQFLERDEKCVVPSLEYRNGIHQFQHSQTFKINKELMEFIENDTLGIQVWGSLEPSTLIVEESLSEKKCHIPKKLEIWVEIMELNDNGDFVPVEVKNKQDVKTGGIYRIHQGQVHRIHVKVIPVEEMGNDNTSTITSAAISSVAISDLQIIHSHNATSLDTYQEVNGKSTLNDIVKYQSTGTSEKVLKRHSIIESTPEIAPQCMAPALNTDPLPGLEKRIPLLFISPSSSEKEGTEDNRDDVLSLPIIKRNDNELSTVVSWDSSAHQCLNKVSQPHERIFAVVHVTVKFNDHPTFNLQLKKKICLKVYRKGGFGVSLSKTFTRAGLRTKCGVTYEIVKSAFSSEKPRNDISNPTFIELGKDDNAIDKIKSTLVRIGDALLLDRLKQQVFLMESISLDGKGLRKHFITKPRKAPIATNLDLMQDSISESSIFMRDGDYEDDVENGGGIKVTLVRRLRSTKSVQNRLPLPSNVVTTIVDDYSSENSETPNDFETVEDKVIDEEIVLENNEGNTMEVVSSPECSDKAHVLTDAIFKSEESNESAAISIDKENSDTEPAQQEAADGPTIDLDKCPPNLISQTKDMNLSLAVSTSSVHSSISNKDDEGIESINPSIATEETAIQQDETYSSDIVNDVTEDAVSISDEVIDVPITQNAEGIVSAVQEDKEGIVGCIEENSDLIKGPVIIINDDNSSENQNGINEIPAVEECKGSTVAVQDSFVNDSEITEDDDKNFNLKTSKEEHKSDSDLDIDKLTDDTSSSINDESCHLSDSTSSDKETLKLEEKVMVEASGTFKMGTIKFIGKTKFASGEWIGIELDKPQGKNNGSVSGVAYFKCKEKFGVFVRRNKVVHGPSKMIPSVKRTKPKRCQSFNRQSSNEWKQFF
ncbi:PREDICTED: kinesin-like protein KIF13B [Amphimedon queenslandica]|uniref:CAP-Gly domain-containing protein n=1 Tax=Amphimedon queenslandica TaxID=400682 RepID=A0A1X7UBI3_AMPQE|nr:PREDICTED: kinesin-like protein KIF13B [Amphimedon queenslandica]|eukprot:XP_019855139.1 PREDICTED: kinesin-like protein KIF13B [Amphimedon queenslandica]